VQAQACFGNTDPVYRFSAAIVTEGAGLYDIARGNQGGAGVTAGFQVPGVLGAEAGWGHRRWYEQRNDTNRLHARVAYAPGAFCPVLSAEHESDELFLTPRNALVSSNTDVMAGLAFGRSFELGRRAAVAPHAAVLTGYRFSDGRTHQSVFDLGVGLGVGPIVLNMTGRTRFSGGDFSGVTTFGAGVRF
jgi:hypothetical protein